MATESGENEFQATIHITKLAAVQRQLGAAIKMFFLGDDDLATHTVAHAAYRVLSDLKEQRGRDEASDSFLRAIFYVIRDYRRGTLPQHFRDDRYAMQWIENAAKDLPITQDSQIEDVELRVPPEIARAYWNKRNAVSNFLKHADRDSGVHLAMDRVDNHALILSALAAYLDVAGDLSPEGLVFWVYSCVRADNRTPLTPPLAQAAGALEKLNPIEQKAFCAEWIRRLQANPFVE